MATNTNRGEPTGTVEQWNNAQAYLGMLSRADWKVVEALEAGNIPQLLRNLEIFYILLKRNQSKNARSREMFDEEQENALRQQIKDLHNEYSESSNIKPTRMGRRRRSEKETEILTKATEVYEALGDYMYEEGLIFEKGIDPNRAWAQG